MAPELAALVVHDLKNALIALEAELDELRRAPDPALAERAHERCAGMRRRFMAFLTLYGSDGELRAHAEDESPEGLLAGIARSMAGGVPRVVTGRCDAAPPYWHFDVRLVRMALDAALHNALRFGRESIVLGAREEGGRLVFTVDDDGPGLGDTAPCASSTGLGTSLCHAVARAHDSAGRAGGVRLFDRPEGGARFELWLA